MIGLMKHGALACCVLLSGAVLAQAQGRPLTGGYSGRAQATVTGEELSKQTNLWVLEVEFKPMRMVSVEVTDPATNEKSREWIWYLAYRAVNRPIDRRMDDSDTEPQNDYDQQPKRPLFIPEFTLVIRNDENGATRIIPDSVIPEAMPAIRAREKRELLNSVAVVREIPEATPIGTPAEGAIYGVAMWRGIDPETDFFTVFMSGFSNGYRITTGPDDQPLVERRTIVQEFWRPGDQFDQDQREIRLKGEPRWLYRADAPQAVATPAPKDSAVPENN